MADKKNKTELSSYRQAIQMNLRAWRIWQKKCPKFFLSILLYSVFTALVPYVTIWLSAQIINELAGGRDPQRLFQLVLIQLISAAGMALVSGVLLRWKNCEYESSIVMDFKIYSDKMLEMDYADVDNQHTYDLYSQIWQNRNISGWGLRKAIKNFEELSTALIRVIGGIGLSIGLFTMKVPESAGKLTVMNHPLFTVLIFGLMIAISLLAPFYANKASEYWARYSSTTGKLGNRFFNFYGRLANDRKRALDLRIYNQYQNVASRYFNEKLDFFGTNSPIAKAGKGSMGLLAALSQIVSVVLTVVIYLFVCLKAWAGAFGVGSVTQYVGAITNLFLGISQMLQTVGTMKANCEFLKPVYEFLDIPNKMYQGSLTTEKRSDRKYEIELKDVSFRYPGSDSYSLRHVNMKFRIGSRLAVVGMNGSGKTTFIKLLCRLYDPTEGQILLNGIDIRKYKYDDYINIFSIVFQDFKLFAMPLGDNVACSSDYDKNRVEHCLQNAGFAERLQSLPEGLNTYLYKDLNEKGVEISGGEAQKIAIARALYKDAPFIILDEPTAALDPIAEAEIYGKFNEIAGDKTAIYISHRLSSCKFCDEIAVFDNGRVVQQGTHQSLVADEGGKYYELWHAQAQYYTEAERERLV